MKKLITALALAAAATTPALAANVGVSAGMGESGYYGRVDINNYPQPVVYNQQPVLVVQQPVLAAPVYMRIPDEHRRYWARHCGVYQACGRPVYFVQDHWYHNAYRPQYAHHHGGRWEREERREHRHH